MVNFMLHVHVLKNKYVYNVTCTCTNVESDFDHAVTVRHFLLRISKYRLDMIHAQLFMLSLINHTVQ